MAASQTDLDELRNQFQQLAEAFRRSTATTDAHAARIAQLEAAAPGGGGGGAIVNTLQAMQLQAEGATAVLGRLVETTSRNSREMRVSFDKVQGLKNLKDRSTDWRHWSFKLVSRATGACPRLVTILDWCASRGKLQSISRELLEVAFGDDDTEGEHVEHVEDILLWDAQFYNVLVQFTEDGSEAATIVQGIAAKSGFEAWRRLVHEYDPVAAGRRRNTMSQVLHAREHKLDELKGAIEMWEQDVRLFERQRRPEGEPLPLDGDIKASILQDMCPRDLREHLLMNASRLQTYDQIKEEIFTYLDGRKARTMHEQSLSSRRSGGDKRRDDPMELDTFQRDNKQQQKPAGPCYTCGGAHWQRDCKHNVGDSGASSWNSSAWYPTTNYSQKGPSKGAWYDSGKNSKGKGKGKDQKGYGKKGSPSKSNAKGSSKGGKGKGKLGKKGGKLLDFENSWDADGADWQNDVGSEWYVDTVAWETASWEALDTEWGDTAWDQQPPPSADKTVAWNDEGAAANQAKPGFEMLEPEYPLGFDFSSLTLNSLSALGSGDSARDGQGWTKLTCTFDTGACACVLPKQMIPPGYCVEKDDLQRSYSSASGAEVVDEGMVRLPCQNEDCANCNLTFRVTTPDVRRALVAGTAVCAKGNRVVLDFDEGSYILNKRTQVITPLRVRNGIFEYDVWVKPAAAAAASGFHWPVGTVSPVLGGSSLSQTRR